MAVSRIGNKEKIENTTKIDNKKKNVEKDEFVNNSKDQTVIQMSQITKKGTAIYCLKMNETNVGVLNKRKTQKRSRTLKNL